MFSGGTMNQTPQRVERPCRDGTVNAAQIPNTIDTSGTRASSAAQALVPIERRTAIHGPMNGMNASPGSDTFRREHTT